MKLSNKLLAVIVALLGGVILAGGIFYEVTLKPGVHMKRPIVTQDTGHVKKMTQENLNLQHLKITGPFQVVIKPGKSNRVSVLADEAVLKQIVMEPSTLSFHVKFKSNQAFVSKTPARIEVTSDAIQHVTLNGDKLSIDAPGLKQKLIVLEAGGNVSGAISGEVEQFVMNVGGGGEFNLQGIKSDAMTLSVTGSTEIIASGETKKLILVGTGAGTIDATRVIAQDVKVSVRGATNVKFCAKETLSVVARGASSVKYLGQPEVLKQDIKGASHMEALD